MHAKACSFQRTANHLRIPSALTAGSSISEPQSLDPAVKPREFVGGELFFFYILLKSLSYSGRTAPRKYLNFMAVGLGHAHAHGLVLDCGLIVCLIFILYRRYWIGLIPLHKEPYFRQRFCWYKCLLDSIQLSFMTLQ